MSQSPFSYVRRGFGFFWRALDASRRTVLNLIFLAIVLIVLYAIFGGGAKPLQPKTTLVLDLKGQLVEQSSVNATDALLANARGAEVHKMIQLRDVLGVLDTAAKDPNVESAVLLNERQGRLTLGEAGFFQRQPLIHTGQDQYRCAQRPTGRAHRRRHHRCGFHGPLHRRGQQ